MICRTQEKIKTAETYVIMIIAFLHLLFTVYTDPTVFTASRREHIIVYMVLKVLLYAVLVLFWKWMFLLFRKEENSVKKITLYSIPYLLILLRYMVLKNQSQLFGDELNIYNNAINYRMTLFTYITELVYNFSLMLIPHQMGAVLIHIILQSLLCGYVLYRSRSYFKTILGFLVFAIFLLAPVITQSIRIHRMHWYGLLYLFVIAKLVFDYMENKSCNKLHFILLSVAFSVLAVWRKEGIYLVLLAPLIIISIYHIKSRKEIISVFAVFFIIFGLVYAPQPINNNRFAGEEFHTLNSWFVNMSRLGLDRSKYPEEMKAIDKYLSLDAVDFINNELGDYNYADEYIAFREGYIGVNFNATQEEKTQYKKAVMKIVFSEPLIFIKTRVGLWKYITLNNFDVQNNPNIPIAALFIVALYGFIKKRWAYILISVGLIANTGITLIFAPAAYPKYYYHTYLIGWLFMAIAATNTIEILLNKSNLNRSNIF